MRIPQKKVIFIFQHFPSFKLSLLDLTDADTVILAVDDVANEEDMNDEDGAEESLAEISVPLELAIQEIRSMSVNSPQIITID